MITGLGGDLELVVHFKVESKL